METRFPIAPPKLVFSSRFFSLSSFLTGLFLLFIMACQQEKDEIHTLPSGHGEDYSMYYKILTFLETKEGKPLTHPVLTPRTTYSPGDILDYVEGGMNLQYTDPRPTWASYDVVTDTFTIPLSSGYASQQDLEDLFDEVVDSASAHFYGIAETDKFPFLYDAVSLGYSTSLMTLKVTSSVGKVNKDLTPFTSTDYWNVGGGKCGPYSGGSDDAQDRMNDALNAFYAPYGCVFYTNVTYISGELEEYGWYDMNQNDPTPGDFSIDYRTFRFFCTDEEMDPEDPCYDPSIPDCDELDIDEILCLDPDELNYYFGSISSMYNSYYFDSGLYPISSDLFLEFGLCSHTFYFWYPEAFFGTQNSCVSSNFPTYLPQCC